MIFQKPVVAKHLSRLRTICDQLEHSNSELRSRYTLRQLLGHNASPFGNTVLPGKLQAISDYQGHSFISQPRRLQKKALKLIRVKSTTDTQRDLPSNILRTILKAYRKLKAKRSLS